MRWVLVGLLGLAGCGRIGFDPPGSAGDGGGDPDGRHGDSSGAPGDGSLTLDAQPAACAEAITIGVGRTAPTDTCTHPDRVDGCAGAGRQEVVFRFVAPATATYLFSAKNPGTQNINNSTAVLDASCVLQTGCAALTGRGFTAGQVVYFVVEASSGACTSIEYEIEQQ